MAIDLIQDGSANQAGRLISNIALFRVWAILPVLGFDGAEVRGSAVPGARLSWVAERAGQSSPPEKSRIESRPHPQRRPSVFGAGGALIEYACRGDITNDDE
jgi:hypothetical protein